MSENMGRNLRKQESQITMKNHSPGCMWGLFHHLQQNRWHKVVKRLPRARLVYGKHSTTGQEREKTSSSNVEEIDQEIYEPSVAKSNVEGKHAEHNPSHRGSVRSRLKAFTEEVYKRKGRHRRSTSYPVRKPPDENLSSHQKGKSIDHTLPPNAVEGSIPTAHPDSSLNMRLNYLKQNEVDQLGKEPVRDHTLLHGNLMYAVEPSKGDSLHESKLFINALNLLNVREEMFMQILKDPSISLANQLHCRRSPNLRYGLNKSLSFSASAPSYARDLDMDSSRKKQETKCVKEEEKNTHHLEGNEHFLRESEVSVSDNATSHSKANILRKNERVGLMHFKNIREKIKYVIRDRKKEKNRIMMDALHHKIPYGASASKKMAEDAGQAGSDFARSSTQEYKRTTSFDNSLDRYNQLIDINPSKEAKDHTCDESKQSATRRKSPFLGRILSLPDIRSRVDVGSVGTNEVKALDRVDEEEKVVTNSVSENENKEEKIDVVGEALDESVDAKARESVSSHDSKDEPETVSSHDSKDESETVLSHDSKDEPETSPAPIPSHPEDEHNDEDVQELESPSSDDSTFSIRPQEESEEILDSYHQQEQDQLEQEQEQLELEQEQKQEQEQLEEEQEQQDFDSLYQSQDMINLDGEEGEVGVYESRDAVGIVEENQIQEFYSELLRVQGDEKNNAEFKYVRGVLELSGFSKGESLGQWQSADYPLDPSMIEEVGGWSGDAHDCSAAANQEDGMSNQLLLFDLINEVLLVIHERSFCYWPTPLTSRSSIHPLPKGSRVLEEVWAEIRWLLSSAPESDQATDDAVSRDLAKNDGWMNLQLDAECVGLELEELILDDLVQEIFAH